MGLDNTSIRYHFYLKNRGFSFQRVALLGRQYIYGVTPNDLVELATKFRLKMNISDATEIIKNHDGYAEGFYHWLGAETVDSYDASDYEKATHLWNMNGPLPDHFRGNYDFVFDGGTLEHVFQFPSALREAMTLPKIGGIFLSATPADSYLGHGLYQFSPDLAFEVLSSVNGYSRVGVYLIELRSNPIFLEVKSPSPQRGRTLASTSNPTLMCWCGQRTDDVPNFLVVNQPDYSLAWDSVAHSERGTYALRSLASTLIGWLPDRIKIGLLRLFRQIIGIVSGNSLWDRPWLKRSKDI